ncbi:MAG TPA: hypothetical protein VFK09_12080 [Gemmatimonadales bacterium]|nr:hypothetical protein [Gemmatimonadales bacterium]
MRKLLTLAAFAAMAACHRGSDTDVGQASPDTGRTDTTMTTTTDTTMTTRTGQYPSDTTVVPRTNPDTLNPAGQTGQTSLPSDTGMTRPSDTSTTTMPSDTGMTTAPGTTTDSIGNRGDSAMVNRPVPDTSASQGGYQPSSTTTGDSVGNRGDTAMVHRSVPDSGAGTMPSMQHDSL